MWWRIFGVFFAAIAAAQTYANHVSVARLLDRSSDLGEVFILAVPLVAVWIALAASVGVIVLPQKASVLPGIVRGAFVGSSLFLVLLEWSLWPKPFAVFTEGTAYWAYLSMPSVWFGLPLIVMGALIGAKCEGAPISMLVLTVIAVPVLWMPVSILGQLAARRIWQILERAFIALFA